MLSVCSLTVSQIRLRLGEWDFSSESEPSPHMEQKAVKKVCKWTLIVLYTCLSSCPHMEQKAVKKVCKWTCPSSLSCPACLDCYLFCPPVPTWSRSLLKRSVPVLQYYCPVLIVLFTCLSSCPRMEQKAVKKVCKWTCPSSLSCLDCSVYLPVLLSPHGAEGC